MRKPAIPIAVTCALTLVLVASGAHRAAATPTGATRLVAPPDGQAYFGFTFRLFDTTDPLWGDTRPFDERIRDLIDTELASKAPTFLSVWAAWQKPDLPKKPLVPFSEALPDIDVRLSATTASCTSIGT